MSLPVETSGGLKLVDWERKPDGTAVLHAYTVHTPAGKGLIGLHEGAIVWLSFGETGEKDLRRYWPGKIETGKRCPLSGKDLEAAVRGRRSLDIKPLGTPFRREVWRKLLDIPFAETCTYAEIADHMGSRNRARAVGTAVGANPVAWLVPCHRVLPASGGTGNYRWGPATKQRLIDWEQSVRPAGRGIEPSGSRRRLEAMLMNAKRFEDITKLAGDIAHDLNNLLAPIRMATQLLKRNCNDSGLDRYIEIIETSTGHARSVIQEILAFSRQGSEPHSQLIDVNHVLREIEKIVRDTFPSRIRLKFHYQEEAPPVRMDPTQLHRAVLNLLVNARDAIKRSGTITVRISSHDLEMRISVGELYLAPGRFICISVADSGSGIPADIRDKIFDPFFTTKPREQGTGLGLASVYAIVARAGGFIDLESMPGRGSTFQIYLPEAASDDGD